MATLPATFVAPLAARLRSLILDLSHNYLDTSVLPLITQCLKLERLEVSVSPSTHVPNPTIIDVVRAVPVAAPLSHLVVDIPLNILALDKDHLRFATFLSSLSLVSLSRLDFPAFSAEAFFQEGFGDAYGELLSECEKRSVSVYFQDNLL